MSSNQPPPNRPQNSADEALWIDRLCDQFEAVWKAHQVPRIEDYLGQIGPSGQPVLLRELLLQELDYRGRAGQHPTADEYRTRFPDYARVVEGVFQVIHQAHTLDAPANDRPLSPSLASQPPAPADPDATQSASGDLPAPRQALRIHCPHCRHPVEILDPAPPDEMTCPSCGSSFKLAGQTTLDWQPTRPEAPTRRRWIAHFELLEPVGSGAYGTVWKARDTRLDRIVAVKVPRHGQLDEHDREKFLREARAAGSGTRTSSASTTSARTMTWCTS